MSNPYVNKVVTSAGTTLIDLSGDTVTSASDIVAGKVGHLADGSQVTGTASTGGGGNTYKSGSFTPSARTTTVDIDIGLTDPNYIFVIPHGETPLKSGGKTFVGGYYTKNAYYKTFLATSNNAGSSLLTPVANTSTMVVTMTGTTAKIYSQKSSSPSINGGAFETIQYDWFAW